MNLNERDKQLKILAGIMVACFALTGCLQNNPVEKTVPENPEFKKILWLTGKWEAVTSSGRYEENWIKTNDSTLRGNTFMISKNDTVFSEELQVIFTKNGIFYHATVADQNNGAPVLFKAVKNDRGLHVFENTAHDFPQKIQYFMKSRDQLLASVTGIENGKFRKEDFNLARVK